MLDESLRKRVERRSARIAAAARLRETLFAQTLFLGALGLMFVLPMVAGAYSGHRLDARVSKSASLFKDVTAGEVDSLAEHGS